MSITAQRAIRRGRGAWRRGNLDAALENLERAHAAAPNSLEALFPLARVLAESDEKERALAVLEQARAVDQSGYVGQVFAAVFRYDHGEWQEARDTIAEIEEVEPRNVFARSLTSLLDLETKDTDTLPVHRGAMWIGETAGRLLAALEARLYAKGQSEVNGFHEKLFTEDDGGSSSPTGESQAADPEKFQVDRDWWAALETAFRAGDHERVSRLYRRKEVPDDWRDVISRVLGGYSLLAAGHAKRALEEARIAARANPKSAWPQVLVGLAHTAMGERRHAIYAFVRAVERSDVEMHRMITELTAKLGISIELLD